MIKIKHYILIYSICCIFSSCFGLFDGGFQTIKGEYEVGWVDIKGSRAIYKQERLIAPYVFAVGHNSKFIISKQHPFSDTTNNSIDTQTTNYFIIDMTKNPSPGQEGIYGPLNKEEFDDFRRKANISNMEFDINYDETP
ncbi:MAG: hypothetical protein JWQ09_1541 [Segetibacter sp.]|nr:hypothetical protein [Segetibacter sp.]